MAMGRSVKNILITADLTVNSDLTKYSLLFAEGLKRKGFYVSLYCINESIPKPTIKDIGCVLQFVPIDKYEYYHSVKNIGICYQEDVFSAGLLPYLQNVNKLFYIPSNGMTGSDIPVIKEKLNIPHISGEYIFYTINDSFMLSKSLVMIEAFFKEFDPSEPVNLIIKTNRNIDNYIQDIRTDLNLYSNIEVHKKIIVLTGVIPYDDIEMLHNTGRCFIFTDNNNSHCIDLSRHKKPYVLYEDYQNQSDLSKIMRDAYKGDHNYIRLDLPSFTDVLNQIEGVIYES